MSETLTLVEPAKTISVEQRVANGIAAFKKKRTDLTELAEKYAGLEVKDINDNKQLKAVSEGRKALKKERCSVEGDARVIRKQVKAVADEVTVLEKELVGIVSPVEDRLEAIENRVEAERERVRLEEEAKENARINAMVKMLLENGCTFDGTHYSIGEMTISQTRVRVVEVAEFTSFVEKVKAENARIIAAENERLRLEAEAKAAERLRIEAEQEQIRKDREELERLRAEAESVRLANEREAKRLQDEREAQERAKAEAERQRIEAEIAERVSELKSYGLTENSRHYSDPLYDCTGIEKEFIADASKGDWEESISLLQQRIEEGKRAAEAKRLADIESAKEQARIEEAARIEAENKRLAEEKAAAELEAARQAALAPDKEKLMKLADEIGKYPIPEMTTEDGKAITEEVRLLISKIQTHILKKIKTL